MKFFLVGAIFIAVTFAQENSTEANPKNIRRQVPAFAGERFFKLI